MVKANTVLFEKKYNVDIKDFSTTCEIDEFIAKKRGVTSLKVRLMHPDIISTRGDVFPKLIIDANKNLDKIINK